MTILRVLWNYRGFILGSVKREFQSKYRNSLLGALWNIINPMATIVVYTVIFAQIMKARLEGVDSTFGFSIYLCAGVLTWGLFSEITTRSQSVFIDNANLLKKVSFPRLCLPVIVVLNALVNFAIIFGLFTFFLLLSGSFPGLVYLAIGPLLFVQILFSAGLGMVLGVLNVFFRDIGQLYGVILQFWFWLTPIVYPASILSEPVRQWTAVNPMSALMAAYQGVFVRGQWPAWGTLLPLVVLSVFLCFFGWRLFRRRVGEMIDEL